MVKTLVFMDFSWMHFIRENTKDIICIICAARWYCFWFNRFGKQETPFLPINLLKWGFPIFFLFWNKISKKILFLNNKKCLCRNWKGDQRESTWLPEIQIGLEWNYHKLFLPIFSLFFWSGGLFYLGWGIFDVWVLFFTLWCG